MIARMGDLLKVYWPYISLFFNAALLLALYFRTALNQLVLQYIEERRAHRERLIRLYDNARRYVAALTSICLYQYIMSIKPNDRPLVKPYWDEASKEFKETQQFIQENKIRFHKDLRGKLTILSKESMIDDLVKQPALLFSRTEKIEKAGNDVLHEIERKLDVR